MSITLCTPIYGYARAVVDKEFGLLGPRETGFDLGPDDLRRVARFLDHYAGAIESGGWRGRRVHLTSFDPSWKTGHSDVEVDIRNPDPEPPAVAH